MNILELKPGDKIGVFYHDNRLGTKAEIGVVKRISPTGQVTLTSGKRYTPDGKEIGAVEPSYLWSLDKIQPVLEKIEAKHRQKEVERHASLTSPKGKRNVAVRVAVEAALASLNQHGWYADIDGEMDVLESELEQKIRSYVERHEPIN